MRTFLVNTVVPAGSLRQPLRGSIITLTLIWLCLLSGGCAETIKRQAHFIPLFDGRVVLSGDVIFIKSTEDGHLRSEMKHPPKHTVMRMKDGSMKVTWITTSRKPEKLIYVESGLHSVQIPDAQIQETNDLNADLPLSQPFLLDGLGPNTAFVEDYIRFGPRLKASQNQWNLSD